MGKTLQPNKFKLNYKAPQEAARAENLMEDLRTFATFYQIGGADVGDTARKLKFARLKNIAQKFGEAEALESLENLILGEAIPANAHEQYLLNLYLLLNYTDEQSAAPLTVQLLRQMHKILLTRLPDAQDGGTLRGGGSLFALAAPPAEGLPSGNELDNLLTECFALANNRQLPAVTRAGLFYYLFLSIMPFDAQNEATALVASRHILINEDYNLFGMLDLEKRLYLNEDLWAPVRDLLQQRDYRERLHADLTPYLECFAKGVMMALEDIKIQLGEQAKSMQGYDGLSPREKNNLNFWLDKAFFKHKHKLPKLTPRQQEIMMIISRQGSLSNKELVPLFQVDRKTIQRDFNALLDTGLVEQRGAGRALKYYLDFRINI